MPEIDLLTGGAAGGGGLLGALMAFIGVKGRIDRLEANKVGEKECKLRFLTHENSLDDLKELHKLRFDGLDESIREIKDDIKEMIRNEKG